MDARSVPATTAAEGAHTADHITGSSGPRNYRSESYTAPTLGSCQGELFGEESIKRMWLKHGLRHVLDTGYRHWQGHRVARPKSNYSVWGGASPERNEPGNVDASQYVVPPRFP